jgi:threonyl-tRNA synthetase
MMSDRKKDKIEIKLWDGSIGSFAKGTTVSEIIKSVDKQKHSEAIAARLNDLLVDLSHKVESDAALVLISKDSSEGLEICRHSASHILAAAVTQLFPQCKTGIGPAIEDGFYYDFLKSVPFTPEDLERIEERMNKIIKDDIPFIRKEVTRDEAIKLFSSKGQDLKVELIKEKGGNRVSYYQLGDFIDFCRGPHVPSSGVIKAFKLLKISGAYWKDDEHNPMLQRIYGTAFFSRKDLQDYLDKLEEAKKRDHRKLGPQLELFIIPQEAGPGLVYWMPKGAIIYDIIESFWKREHQKRGYQLVKIPHIALSNLWETSGHFQYYRENMYTLQVEDQEYVLKPMNCPGHILIYKSKLRSYRELPIRYAELGTVYRYERSGTLHGTLRVRGFTQDDAHIFCTPEQLPDEIVGVLDLVDYILKTFCFEKYNIELSVRDPNQKSKYAGNDEEWEQAEKALINALKRKNLPYKRMEGEAVFYGPKIDVKLIDSLGRGWQASTIQFDFNIPRRMHITYIGSDSKEHTVLMVHRTIFGSLERFIGNLIEHLNGAFPIWLSPIQAIILPITDRQADYTKEIAHKLEENQIRAEIDTRNEKINLKIREAQLQKIPYMIIVGDKEEKNKTIAVRNRILGDMGEQHLEKFIEQIKQLIEKKACQP